MLSRRHLLMTAAATATAAALPKLARAEATYDAIAYVDPFIGTGGHGHVYPGATVPFGAVQLSPDTNNSGWDSCSGYYYSDPTLMGFSHTHLSGTGASDMMDLLVLPFTGETKLDPGTPDNPGYRTRMSHEHETATPGYYAITLPDSGIRCELTAGQHTGMHRYTFPAGVPARLLIDWAHGYRGTNPTRVKAASLTSTDSSTLSGSRTVGMWANGRQIHFALKLSQPAKFIQFYDNDVPIAPEAALSGKSLKAVLDFGVLDAPLLIRVGLSAVDVTGALDNLDVEMPDFDFDRNRLAASVAWQAPLSRIRVETDNAADRAIFMAALYHAHLAPTLFCDRDGRYRAMDSTVKHLAPGRANYSTYSLWDTYRAWHPLMTLIAPDMAAEFARNLIDQGDESPAGPCIWPLQGIETYCMIGWHSASAIAEALVKGLPGIDVQKAWAVYRKLAFERQEKGLNAYRDTGFIPADLEGESVSKTLEYAYDDWAMAHIAWMAGDRDAAEALLKRSGNYRNVFDRVSNFARPRLSDGTWAEPFDPRSMGHDSKTWWDYTESNSWQATFLNQHDLYGAIELFGGDDAYVAKLDALFDASSELPADAPPDMDGMIGQYVHGNEPSHHIAYLYAFAGQPWKTQARIRMILDGQYRAGPDGMAGNEDCGQMSAWYILSSLGFYPVDPVGGVYVFGSPIFPKAVMDLGNGQALTITTEGAAPERPHIASILRNGQPWTRSWIGHSDLIKGGTLHFVMSDQPNYDFGTAQADRPPSFRPTALAL